MNRPKQKQQNKTKERFKMNAKTDIKENAQSPSNRTEKSARGLKVKTSVKAGTIRRLGLPGLGR
jgi:hypothetical protein